MQRICTVCQERLLGRSDQKFCSDFCRNQFHNHNKRTEYHYFRTVNRRLQRNRAILFQLYQQTRLIVQWDELMQSGFDPYYCTACRSGEQGQLVFYCYDMAYQKTNAGTSSVQLSWIQTQDN